MKTIEIVVDPRGETRLQTKGFMGAECQRASKPLEQALGLKADETLTAEFHQSQPENQRLSERS